MAQASTLPSLSQNGAFRETVDKLVHCKHPKDCSHHVGLHLFVMMMGVHAVKSRQNETFHLHNQMNISSS
jgi:hypothetical protein